MAPYCRMSASSTEPSGRPSTYSMTMYGITAPSPPHGAAERHFAFTGIEYRDDVRVRQFRYSLGLAAKSLAERLLAAEIAVQGLDRNLPVERRVVRQIYGGHATGTQQVP